MNIQNIQSSQSHKKTINFRLKYKTQVFIILCKKCRYLLEKGFCPYSQSCTFAHYQHEIRNKIDIPYNYKTKICINFSNKGFCNYGQRCQYLHTLCPQEDGRQTRSNSQESNSSKSSLKIKNINKLWDNITHHKRVQLIQNLGLDFTIRKSSRLLQLLNSNQKESDYSTDQENDFEIFEDTQRKQKKYSL